MTRQTYLPHPSVQRTTPWLARPGSQPSHTHSVRSRVRGPRLAESQRNSAARRHSSVEVYQLPSSTPTLRSFSSREYGKPSYRRSRVRSRRTSTSTPTLRTTSVTHADAAGVTRRVEWLSAGLIRFRCRRTLVGQRRARRLIRRNHQSLRRQPVRNALVRELPPSPAAAPEPTCLEPPWRTRSSRRRAKKATTPEATSNLSLIHV